MADRVLLGHGRSMIPLPRWVWQPAIRLTARQARASLTFMSADHHRVRDLVVLELPRAARPLRPEHIAETLALPPERVRSILTELERRLTFLVTDAEGAVTWAYPVTIDQTPHKAAFSTGEEAYSP